MKKRRVIIRDPNALTMRKFLKREGTIMKLGTFKTGDRQFSGAVLNDAVVIDIVRAALAHEEFRQYGPAFADMRTLLPLAEQAAALLAVAATRDEARYRLSDLEVMAPITNPNKIICVGLNYLDHALESNEAIPTEPVIFTKFRTSLTGTGSPIRLPRVSNQVDYEAELAVVVKKTGKRIPEAEAWEYVAGYTAMNDVSARDLQMRGSQWTKGKVSDTFAPLGPYLVTADEVGDPHQLRIQLELNGKIMQDSRTDQLIFKIPCLISFLSELFTLEPGDIISTGTPPGVGFVRKPPVFLKPGDQVSVIIEKIGRLTNLVVEDSNVPERIN
jgi:2-keto-4-pentenoate hydratase/2-oxohepta-3-ene-1,7-dioic acid hydratase in catechol pathway